MSKHRGFTPKERERSQLTRREIARERRDKVRMLLLTKTKKEIAEILNVDDKTIWRDCKALEAETPPDHVQQVIDAFRNIVHQELTGEITEAEAEAEIRQLILTVATETENDV